MKSKTQQREDDLYEQAVKLTDPSEREVFLVNACGGDATLLTRMRELLACHTEATDLQVLPTELMGYLRGNANLPEGEQSGDRIGRYKLLQQIGEGGFGTVWMAEQMEPVTRRVALKIIKLGMDTKEVIARFEAERQALALMDHANIAKVLDAGATEQGRPFFVMELVKGVTITQYCDEAGLNTRERLALFGDICLAINHAHQKGVIHRDIKPSNVMVTMHGEKSVVKVIDFGIAKATQGRLTDKTLFTRFEQFIGTPVYMSPEQAATSGLDIDTRSDIYSLGILLYELLVGKPPFDARTLASAGHEEMRRIIREVEPMKPSSRIATMVGQDLSQLAKAHSIEPENIGNMVEADLDWIVMKAIDKTRNRRYETANELALDIKRFLADEPVTARPPSMSYQMGKFIRRHRTQVMVALLILAILLAGIAGTTFGLIQARSSASAERSAKYEAELRRMEAEQQQHRAEANEKRATDSERNAKEQAANAEQLANYVNAKYMLSQGRVGPAIDAIGAAIRIRPHWEYGYLLSEMVRTARKDWSPVAHFAEVTDPRPSAAAFVGPSGQLLSIISGRHLRLFDVTSSRLIGETDLGTTAANTFKIGASFVGVYSGRSVRVYSLEDLRNNRELEQKNQVKLAVADPSGNLLAVLTTDGQTQIFDIATLKTLASHNFNLATEVAATRVTPTLDFSPSGKTLLFSSGLWMKPSSLWEWGSDQTIEHSFGRINSAKFLDDETVVGVIRQSTSGDHFGFSLKDLRNLEAPPTRVDFSSTAGDNPFFWRQQDDFSKEMLLAASTSADSIDIFSLTTRSLLSSTRFTTLLPMSAVEPRFLAFNPDSGLLAVAGDQGVTVFQSTGFKTRDVAVTTSSPMQFWSMAAAKDGIFTAETKFYERGQSPMKNEEYLLLNHRSFIDEAASKILCQWPKASDRNAAHPWGLAVTPDGKTVAVLWQENSGGGNIIAKYFRKAILIFQLDSISGSDGNQPLIPKRTIWLDKHSGLNGRSNRGICLSPDGKMGAFFPGNDHAVLFNVDEGKTVADLEVGPTVCPSTDGSLFAGGSFRENMPVRVWRTGSQTPVFTTPTTGKMTTAAITPDNLRLYVGWSTGVLECFDLTSCQSISKTSSNIAPLAISPDGDRFIGFLPANTATGNATGSCVLGNLANGKTILIINEGAHVLNRAFFSQSGNAVAFMQNRDSAGIARALTMQEAEKQLSRITPFVRSIPSSTAVPGAK